MDKNLEKRLFELAAHTLEQPTQRLYVGNLHLYTSLDDESDKDEPPIRKVTCFSDVKGGLDSHWELVFDEEGHVVRAGYLLNDENDITFDDDEVIERTGPFLDAAAL